MRCALECIVLFFSFHSRASGQLKITLIQKRRRMLFTRIGMNKIVLAIVSEACIKDAPVLLSHACLALTGMLMLMLMLTLVLMLASYTRTEPTPRSGRAHAIVLDADCLAVYLSSASIADCEIMQFECRFKFGSAPPPPQVRTAILLFLLMSLLFLVTIGDRMGQNSSRRRRDAVQDRPECRIPVSRPCSLRD